MKNGMTVLSNQMPRIATNGGGTTFYSPQVLSAQDYYPFGMLMPERSFSSEDYRFGFNGYENDYDMKGIGNSVDFGERFYDTRIARFLSIDPKTSQYSMLSPYHFGANNPILFIDKDGLEPIDPRTGKSFNINLSRAAVFDLLFIDRTKLKIVKDRDLYENANPLIARERNKPNGNYEGGVYHKHESVWEHTSSTANKALNKITGHPGGSDFGAPNDKAWRTVAEKGSYIFIDDSYAESEWLFINQLQFNVISVEENYITQIVSLTRPDDNSKYNITSVTSFSIQKGDIQTRTIGTWWGGSKQEKYRTLTVTETTEVYKDNKATGNSSSKTYKQEEIVN